jgi:hypothetical protein
MARPPRFGMFGRRKASARPMPQLGFSKRQQLLEDLPLELDEATAIELLGKTPLPQVTYCKSPRALYRKADIVALLSGAKLEEVASEHKRFGPDAEPSVSALRETLPISWRGPGAREIWRRYSDGSSPFPTILEASQRSRTKTIR